MSVLRNVGVGLHLPGKGLSLPELMDDLHDTIRRYQIPKDARICRPGPGSVYLFEIQWIADY